MPAIFIVNLSIFVATVGMLLLTRAIARVKFNRAIARIERGLAFPPWPPAPHEASAEERAVGSNE